MTYSMQRQKKPVRVAILGAIKRFSSWDWLVGIVVAISLLFAAAFTGHGMFILAKATLAQMLLDKAWAATLAEGKAHKPWPWLDSQPVARISVPRLGEDSIVLAGASGQALAFGPTLVNGTARPGTTGLAVFAAHRDTHFAFMDQLTIGDIVEVTDDSGIHFAYEIRDLRVAPWNSSGLDPAESGTRLALVTCWPLDSVTSGPLRYIAEAELIVPVNSDDTIILN